MNYSFRLSSRCPFRCPVKHLLIISLLLSCSLCCSHVLSAASSSWQAAEDAAQLADSDQTTAIQELLDILLDEPQLYVAHYNLGSILLQHHIKTPGALSIEGLADSDPLLLASDHLQEATHSPLPKLSARARHNLALARFQQGRLEDALQEADAALEFFPENESFLQTRNELRRSYLQRLNEARLKAEEEAKRLRLVTGPLPDAFVGRPYSHQLQARGGAGNGYRFSINTENPLPESLKVSPTGLITGTANEDSAGQHALHFILKDGNNESDISERSAEGNDENSEKGSDESSDESSETVEGEKQLRIWPRAKITTEQLPEAIINQSYLATLECQGLPQAEWFVNGLPDGLTIKHSNGARIRIEGSATHIGEYPLQITAKDSKNNLIGVAELKITVSDSFAPDNSDLPAATAWAAYTYTMNVRGPIQRYTFMSAGSGGLSVSMLGQIAGKPEEAGTIELPLTIESAHGHKRSFIIEIPVNNPPVISEEDKIEVYIGQSLNRQIKHQGGTAPMTWQLEEGLLPDGVRLDEDGVLRGVAGSPEEAEVTIALSDRWGARTQKNITLHFKAADPKQQGQDKKEQDKEEPDKENQKQEDDKNKKSEEDGEGEDKNKEDEAKEGEDNKSEQQKQQEAQEKQDELEAAEKQAEKLNKASAQNWLDNLPEESKEALLYQMLKDGVPPNDGQDPW